MSRRPAAVRLRDVWYPYGHGYDITVPAGTVLPVVDVETHYGHHRYGVEAPPGPWGAGEVRYLFASHVEVIR